VKGKIMRKTVLVGSLFILSILLSGCIFVSSSKTQGTPQEHPKSPCVQTPPVSATIAEIDAAGKLASHSSRANIYKAIARRPGLLPQERIHLTNAITTHLASHSDREEVLLILVNNHPTPVQPAPRQSRTAKPPIPCTPEPQNAEKK
jgi:hypothetical protein